MPSKSYIDDAALYPPSPKDIEVVHEPGHFSAHDGHVAGEAESRMKKRDKLEMIEYTRTVLAEFNH